MTRILITRPQEDSESLAETLRQRGWQPVIEPMLDIVWLDGPAPETTGVQALLFTSANGVRAFARRTPERGLPVLTVGRASAAAARAAGFRDVAGADGDVEALARLAASRCDPGRGPLLHVAGTVVAGDLAGLLGGQGFAVRRLPLYEARTATTLSEEVTSALPAGQIAAAMFFSPRTARTFVRLLNHMGLAASCRAMVAYCLSAAVADAIRTLPADPSAEDGAPQDRACVWREVRVAGQPELDSLLALLEAWPTGRPDGAAGA